MSKLMMQDSGDFVKRFYKLSHGVRLIWAACAVFIALFEFSFFPIIGTNYLPISRSNSGASTAVPLNTNIITQNNTPAQNPASFPNPNQQLAQAKSPVNGGGQVKAISTLTLPRASWGSVGNFCANVFPPICFWGHNSSPGITSWSSEIAWATFSPPAAAASNVVLDAKLAIGYDTCADGAVVVIRDASNMTSFLGHPLAVWSNLWNAEIGSKSDCTAGTIQLNSAGRTLIHNAIATRNPVRISLTSPGPSLATNWPNVRLGSLALIVTVGDRELDIKANGTSGSITVAGGSNVNLTWNIVGYDRCRFDSIPAWYTQPGWPTGKTLTPAQIAAGGVTVKVYYEMTTYGLQCKDTASGLTAVKWVTVFVTP